MIPEFKEKSNFNEVVNFTSLPSSLTKKKLKKVNYSKLIFLTISLLTIVVIIFVLILIKKSSSAPKKMTSPNSIVLPTPTIKSEAVLLPSPKPPTVEPTEALSPSPEEPTVEPTEALSPSPTVVLSPSPTEIILAKTTACTGQTCITPTQSAIKLQTLPETGNIEKGLLIIGVAISTIFFSFWF